MELAQPSRMRVALTCAMVGGLFSGAIAAFWAQDWRYALPTPRPHDLVQPELGRVLPRDAELTELTSGDRPVLLHFMNPSCPCSRFNVDHVRALVRAHRDQVRFVAVLQGNDALALAEKFESYGLEIEAVVDREGALATTLGVYSTPQAVIFDRARVLHFRGNYNRSRFCSARETEYARIALEEVLAGRSFEEPAAEATLAYGCALPSNEDEKVSP